MGSKPNKQQQEAIDFKDGNCIVLSFAGSGKTFVLENRIKKLVKNGVVQKDIIAISFTKDSAEELKKRLGKECSKVEVKTFHSLCLKFLSEEGIKKKLFFNDWKFEKGFKEKFGGDENIPKILSWISFQKNNGFTSKSKTFKDTDIEVTDVRLRAFYTFYDRWLSNGKLRDFDDMLLEFILLAKKSESFRKKINKRYKYIIVDEHQDSNNVQQAILKLISGSGNLMAVGDFRQCLVPETQIITENGTKDIKDIVEGDMVLGSVGHGDIGFGKVESVMKSHKKDVIFKITTESGNEIKGTGEHIAFVNQTINNKHYERPIFRHDNPKNITFSMFGEKRNGNSTYSHSILSSTTNEEYANHLSKFGNVESKKNGKGLKYFNFRKTLKSQDDILEIFNNITKDDSSFNIKAKATLTKDKKKYDFVPFRNIKKGMSVVILIGDETIEDKVVSVKLELYEGDVYDLNIKELRNYIADGVVVHNCIYSFRGSNVNIILNFLDDWDNAKIISLPKNYRSTDNIVEIANGFIKQTYGGHKLYTDASSNNKSDGIININNHNSTNYEIKRLIEEEHVDPNDIAILYRSHFLSMAYEIGLRELEVPYVLVGKQRHFSDKPEINLLLSYLKLAIDNSDEESFMTVYNSPNRFLKRTFMERVVSSGGNLLNARTVNYNEKKGMESLKEVINFIPLNTTPDVALKAIIKATGIERVLLKTDSGEDKVKGLNLLVGLAKQFKTIPQLLFMIEKMKKEPKKKKGVQMMTVHASKGLEFKHVFVVDVRDGIFPHSKSDDEDERRLFYVAITRAIEGLHIYGNGTYVEECESILAEIESSRV